MTRWATIALALAKAARYDPENQLAAPLLELFKELARDRRGLVHNRFCEYTLPHVTSLHLQQIKATLHDLTLFRGLNRKIALGLALAYRTRPEEVHSVLNTWHSEGTQQRPVSVKQDVFTTREGLLATVALTYGEIDYEYPHGPIRFADGFACLTQIHTNEPHAYVRAEVFTAMSRLSERTFDEKLLQNFVRDVLPQERYKIVNILVHIYFHQRAEQKGGEETYFLDKRRFAVWLQPDQRPLTQIEQALTRWILDSTNKPAQQVALWAREEFLNRLDRKLNAYVAQVQAKQDQQDDHEVIFDTTEMGTFQQQLHQLGHRLILWFVSWNNTLHRSIISGLLPEALRREGLERDKLMRLLDTWNNKNAQDTELRELGRRLKFAMQWAHWAKSGWAIPFMLLILLILFCSCGWLVQVAMQ